MTDRPPVTFQNYPLDPDATTEPEPPLATPKAVTGWQPTPPPQQPPSGPSRRRVIGAVGFGVACLGLASWVVRDGSTEPGIDTEYPTSEVPLPNVVTVGGYEVTLPDGWDVDDQDLETIAVLSKGANRVTFRFFNTSGDATGAEEAQRLLSRYTKELKNQGKISTRSGTDGDLRTGRGQVAGRVGGKPAEAEARVVLSDEENTALAVITVVLDNASDAVRKQVATMRDEFLDQLG